MSLLADSLRHVQGPVCCIVSEPWVAGKTLGEKRVVTAIGGAVLHQSAMQEIGSLFNVDL